VPSSPVESEATGRQHVVATYQGHDFRLPCDVEDWPLPLVAASLVSAPGSTDVKVDHLALRAALAGLLGPEQWPRFETAFPKRKHLVPVSHVFAAAVGFIASAPLRFTIPEPQPKTKPPAKPSPPAVKQPVDDFFDQCGKVFGTLVRVLALIELCPDKVESDLRRFWGIRYSDRYRRDDVGNRRLTLREIGVCLANLPAESALSRAMGHHAPAELLLMDLYERMSGHAHPSRPLTGEQLAERRQAADKEDTERKAAEDYRRRHGLPPRRSTTSTRSLIETARANAAHVAQPTRKASAYAQTPRQNPARQATG
jgi:hypothetical protein